jgi:hypothetical protein
LAGIIVISRSRTDIKGLSGGGSTHQFSRALARTEIIDYDSICCEDARISVGDTCLENCILIKAQLVNPIIQDTVSFTGKLDENTDPSFLQSKDNCPAKAQSTEKQKPSHHHKDTIPSSPAGKESPAVRPAE